MDAKAILMRAVECDTVGRILEAQINYQEGIQMLMDLVQDEINLAKKKVYYERIKEYIDRAEQIKQRVKNHVESGELLEHKPIDDDSIGNSYQSLFGKYLNAEVKEVLLEEPYLKERYQNLIIFLELVVKNCRNLKFIQLITKSSAGDTNNILNQIKADLAKRKITMVVVYQETLHDRKIVLSSGIIIKIGRGLHFFKASNPLYSLGLCDYDFRKCLQTDADIWRTKNL